MFHRYVHPQTELRLLDHHHAEAMFRVIQANRDHIRKWHPCVDLVNSPAAAEQMIQTWLQQHANNRGFFAGIWHADSFCGLIHHVHVDWVNRWTAFGYWLDAAHQGRGIMTACCRAMVEQAFTAWKLNRVTIECATENTRSRAIPERLGFTLEGVTRQVEWVRDHFVDHAIYGLLRADYLRLAARGEPWGERRGASQTGAPAAPLPSPPPVPGTAAVANGVGAGNKSR